MLDFPEPERDDSDLEVHLICRHCDARITKFNPEDPACPDY